MKTSPRTNAQAGLIASMLASCVIVLLAGCGQPPDPRTAPIAAATPEEFTEWKNSVSQKIPRSEMDEFTDCVNEIRKGIMQRREASGAGPVAQKLCEYIHGKTMRDVIVMGHNATIAWVTGELALQRTNIDKTEAALSGPGSDSKKQELRDYLVIAKDNAAKLEARLGKAKARLAELGAP